MVKIWSLPGWFLANATGALPFRSSTARIAEPCRCRKRIYRLSCQRSIRRISGPREKVRVRSLRWPRFKAGSKLLARVAEVRLRGRRTRWTPSSTLRGTSSDTWTQGAWPNKFFQNDFCFSWKGSLASTSLFLLSIFNLKCTFKSVFIDRFCAYEHVSTQAAQLGHF